MRRFILGIAYCAVACLLPGLAFAQSVQELRELVNQNAVYVMGGSPTGTNLQLVWDMAKNLDDGYDMRVLPIAGRGSMKTTEDILLLRGIDAGIVQADVLDFFIELGEYPGIRDNLRYISSLHSEEVHIVVRRDSGIESLEELEGKKVNFGPNVSGTFLTSSVIFDKAGVTVEAYQEPYDFGLDMLRRGEIDAIVRVAGAPTSFLKDISIDDGLKLLTIPDIGSPYEPSQFTSDDYPGLVSLGEEVQTVAIPAVLIAYNHPDGPRRRKVDKFATEVLARLDEFKSGATFNPAWKEVDAYHTVSGWVRWGSSTPDS